MRYIMELATTMFNWCLRPSENLMNGVSELSTQQMKVEAWFIVFYPHQLRMAMGVDVLPLLVTWA